MRSTSSGLSTWLFPVFVLLGLTLVFRFFSFFPSVINHDESTYILIAREMLHGKHYFIDVIDTKPIGIFLIYAMFQWIGGESIALFRIFCALWITATALGLFAIADRHLGGRQAAWMAGVSYIMMTSIFTFYGVSPNTELFFTLFVVLALWWILGGKQWWRYILAGGALGIGFMIKYVVAFDSLAIGLLLIWLAHQQEAAWWKGLLRGLLMFVSFLVPFALVFQYYRMLGYESEFLYYTFEVSSKYPVEPNRWKMVEFYFDFFLRYLPVTGLAAYALIKGKERLGPLWLFFIFWMVLDGYIIGWPGKRFGHYFVQLMPAVCLLGGLGYACKPRLLKWWGSRPRSWHWGLGILVTVFILYTQKKDYYDPWDHPKEVAAFLKDRLEPGDQIYTGNYHHILYFLLERETPTPYVHRSLLWAPHHISALGIDLESEARQILALRPRFMIMEYTPPQNVLSDSLFKYYEPIEVIRGRITIYERK